MVWFIPLKFVMRFASRKSRHYAISRKKAGRSVSPINALESINGHLNHIVGLHNPFWTCRYRLAEQIGFGISKFTTYVQDNFNRSTRKAWMSSHSFRPSEIDAQTEFYNSTQFHCDYRQAYHLPVMYDIPILCCHQLYFGGGRTKMDFPPKLLFEGLIDEFESQSV
jgi:hypothetical protein